MLRKSFKDRCRHYQHSFKASLGNYGMCDVFRFETAQDSYSLLNTKVNWLIINDTDIIAFGGIPESLMEDVDLVRRIFDAVKDGCKSTPDIVARVRDDNPNHLLSPALITARVLKLISEGSLERGPHRSVQLPSPPPTKSEIALVAIEKVREENKPLGTIPIGFKVSDEGTLVPDKEEQEVIDFIFYLKESGESIRNITRILNDNGFPSRGQIWHKTTVHRILHARKLETQEE